MPLRDDRENEPGPPRVLAPARGAGGRGRGRRKRASLQVQAARAIILLIKLNAANSKGRLINGVFA